MTTTTQQPDGHRAPHARPASLPVRVKDGLMVRASTVFEVAKGTKGALPAVMVDGGHSQGRLCYVTRERPKDRDLAVGGDDGAQYRARQLAERKRTERAKALRFAQTQAIIQHVKLTPVFLGTTPVQRLLCAAILPELHNDTERSRRC
jgi:hypothetical protein